MKVFTHAHWGIFLLYLDPGSGSLLLQLLLAGLLGIGVAVRLFWKRLTSLGARKKLEPPETENDAEHSSKSNS